MDMSHYKTGDGVAEHYGTKQLENRIRGALEKAFGNTQPPTWAELVPLDQFHVRGLAATEEMAESLNLRAGATLLDIGCGLGGPARFLAAKYGCRATGIDLNEQFIAVDRLLTQRTVLDVDFEVMDALNLSFSGNSFDAVWTQHAAMNIADRAKLYANVHRVLKPGGRFAIYDVITADRGPLVFPVPWARAPEMSFLLTEQEMRVALRDAGFAEVSWIDQTAAGIEWFDEQQSLRPIGGPQPALGLHLVMGPEFSVMAANLGRNLKEQRARLLQVIAERP